METHDELVYEMKLARLREQLSVGVGQLERGEGVQLDSPSAVDGFFGHIIGQDR
jgi:antitoxin ParD1/3/4